MVRPASGQIVEYETTQGRAYALRLRAYGRREYLSLATTQGGWTRGCAEDELASVLADVRRGIWKRPTPQPAPVVPADPTFQVFASHWFEQHAATIRPTTAERYRWGLSCHLLPFFARHHLSQITIAEVDRYRADEVRHGRIGATSVNMTIALLAQILDVAIERHAGLLSGKPARGRRRRLKSVRPSRTFLEAASVAALLDAAGELDAEARGQARETSRSAIIATLVLAADPARPSQPEPARTLIDLILARFPTRIIELVMDGAYASKAWRNYLRRGGSPRVGFRSGSGLRGDGPTNQGMCKGLLPVPEGTSTGHDRR